jgi:hypothetical protein
MRTRIYLVPVWATVAFSTVAVAHHSTAAYDLTRDVVIEGVVEEYHWTNPHSWIKVLASSASGESSWTIEFGTPSISVRTGWTPTTFKPGDKATFVFHPRRDGSLSGTLSVVILPDGKRLAGATPPAGPIPSAANGPQPHAGR